MEMETLSQANDLARRGSEAQAQARALFLKILENEPTNEEAWMGYINTLANNPERIKALNKYLQINPDSEVARQRLAILGKEMPESARPPAQTPRRRPLVIALFVVCALILLAGGYTAGTMTRPNRPENAGQIPLPALFSTTEMPFSTPVNESLAPTMTAPPSLALPTLDVTLPPPGNPIVEALVVFPVELCSPIRDVPLTKLDDTYLLDNYHPPLSTHSDARHQGVDLGYYTKDGKVGMTGAPIDAILPGRVAGVTENRWPYGNVVIIETRYTDLAEEFSRALHLGPHYSLYHLYSHLDKASVVKPGELVSCGQEIGQAGTSGHSTVPHLHFETRIGPPGEDFGSMAYYDQTPSPSPEEKHAYLYWRISGIFQHFNPLDLFALYGKYAETKHMDAIMKWKTPLPTGVMPTPEETLQGAG